MVTDSSLAVQNPADCFLLLSAEYPEDAQIEDRINFSGIPDSGKNVPGVQILVRSGARKFKRVSDAAGWFHLSVPPGKYSVEIQPIPHWNISPYELSYDDSQKVSAKRGHCSGLQFVAESM